MFPKKVSKYQRYLYAIEFEDNSVYVGLTCNFQKRYDYHIRYTPQIVEQIKKGIKYRFVTYPEIYTIDIAGKKELELHNKYKESNWKMLNKAKPGSLGGKLCLWTLEKCLTDAKKYTIVEDWSNNSRKAYVAAKYHGWLSECISHMTYRQMPRNYWNKERCLEIALKYKTRNEWYKNHIASYSFARRSGCLVECTQHMGERLYV
jgi:predicted GIY-YIG superfamily endonuclease